jgi:hypothetical protein
MRNQLLFVNFIMMKKHMKIAVIAGLFLAGMTNVEAQQVADFEDLSLAAESFYDGTTDHSGTEYATESFPFTSGNVTFNLSVTDWGGGFLSYGGTAYSNQTDLTTASYTNYSAYADPAGGANGSANYGVYYMGYGVIDSIVFPEAANLQSIQIANHVWTYHYIMGSDGSGTGTFEAGDYLTLTLTAFDDADETIGTIDIALADFTDGNSDIISNWTSIDLSSLENVAYIKFSISSNDSMCPSYFCLDDLTYSTSTDIAVEQSAISIYPNPVKDYLVIQNANGATFEITDIYGKIIETGIIHSDRQQIAIENYPSGIYLVNFMNNSRLISKKIIK